MRLTGADTSRSRSTKRGERRLPPAGMMATVRGKARALASRASASMPAPSRRASDIVTASRSRGEASLNSRKRSRVIARTRESRSADTVAVRGSPAKNPISPIGCP